MHMGSTLVGSDHFPIFIEISNDREEISNVGVQKWSFKSADWKKFEEFTDCEMKGVDLNVDVDRLNSDICNIILEAAKISVLRTGGRIREKKSVPWWSNECSVAVRSRNKAFKKLKKNHCFQNLIEYQRMQANVRRVIKLTKREYWRKFCSTIGRETKIDKVWYMIKRMNGIKREYGYR